MTACVLERCVRRKQRRTGAHGGNGCRSRRGAGIRSRWRAGRGRATIEQLRGPGVCDEGSEVKHQMSYLRLSRRQLLAGVALSTTAAENSISPAQARSISGEMPWALEKNDAPRPVEPGLYQFF